MTNLSEKIVNTAVSFTEVQKSLLVKMKAAPTPKVAGDEITTNQNEVTARDILVKLGMITYDRQTGQATITDKGSQAMIGAGLTDELGEITENGQKYLKVGSAAPKTPEDVTNSFESLEFFKEINELSKFR